LEIPRRGGGVSKAKFLKESMHLNWNFQRGGGSNQKNPSVGGVWIFSETTQSEKNVKSMIVCNVIKVTDQTFPAIFL